MATTARQTKPARKGPEPARRQPAWTGARASPTFSPTTTPRPLNGPPPAANQGTFPPLSQPNGTRIPDNSQDRVLQSLSGLTGTTITLLTKTAQRYEGVISSTNGEGDTTGVTLKDVKEISNPSAPLKELLFIASTNIETWSSGPADSKVPNGDSFRTDTDISGQKSTIRRERELQAWQPAADAVSGSKPSGGDDHTFDLSSNNSTSWDQFAANEELFGVTTKFDEDLYTTKLDRSAADFKERERKAQRIANEIIGAGTSNPHIAEERNMNMDDSGVNEEDKYGAVVRGTNAYVPPGARKFPSAASPPVANAAKADIPKVSVNGPDGSTVPQPQAQSPPSSSKASSPAPPSNSTKPPADPLPAFRDFVTSEKQRLTQKRQALQKSEMDKRMAELVKFSQSFKLNKPIPDDLVPILAKDEEKQKQIREKATKDAASTQARNIGSASTSNGNPAPATSRAGPPHPAVGKLSPDPNRKPGTPANGNAKVSVANPPASAVTNKFPAMAKSPADPPKTAVSSKPGVSMVIQAIPPFKGGKTRQTSNPGTSSASNGVNPMPTSSSSSAINGASTLASPMSPTTAANNRLNVNASSFRPNPKANAFTPGTASPIASASNNSIASASASVSVSPKPKPESAHSSPATPNPFFGSRPIKKNPPVHIKDDFNPFKHNKVAEASAIPATWNYSGKRYMLLFPPPQHPPQQHSPHMVPPGPPPMPPPSYEEDSAAQAAARGYVYAYPPYGYPGQPMMPGMVPPGPPGSYMPSPFMQPMPYPPGMPPPNGQRELQIPDTVLSLIFSPVPVAMYASPGMGQMPPPQAYMPPPPPPGQYPPPPNGAGPRPSMPPTPIPSHAHPYYHQSPQRMISFDQYTGKMFTMPTVQHAVPYPMMMMPPPGQNVPPHQYEGGPAIPVQMGGGHP